MGGATKPLTTSLNALNAGLLYFQLHTFEFQSPNGEVRGQISLVPEPVTATLGLMGIGVLGMATRRRVA